MSIRFDTPCQNKPFTLHPVKRQASRSGEVACSPFQDGQLAFISGIAVGRNPHNADSEEHWQWMAGWADEGMKRAKARLANRSTRTPAASLPCGEKEGL